MIGGLVLAAGEGKRFGGPKQLARLGGRPLLEHAIRAMEAVPAIERIVVVIGARADEVRAKVDPGEAEWVECHAWREGIAASLRSGLSALEADDPEAVVIALGDQPFVTPQVIAAIVDGMDAAAPAVRATYGGVPGHPALVKRALFADLHELRGDEGARHVLDARGVSRWECGHLCRHDDIDTPEDLEVASEAGAVLRG